MGGMRDAVGNRSNQECLVMKHSMGIAFFLAAFLIAAPFGLRSLSPRVVMWNEMVSGLIVVGATFLILRNARLRGLWLGIAFGIGAWLFFSPFMLGYPPARSGADLIIGSLLVMTTVIEMYQPADI
jgi:hypothetical protein